MSGGAAATVHNLWNAIQGLKWQDWATLISICFGIVSLIGYIDQRRTARGQNSITAFAERHVQKDISEEAIAKLQEQRVAMEQDVKLNIPALARTAVLKEQAEMHARAIGQHYVEWKQIQSETVSPTGGKLDPELEKMIVDRLLPSFERQVALDRLRNRVTVLSVALALVGNALPYPLNTLASILLAFPLGGTLVQFYKATTTDAEAKRTADLVRLSFIFAYMAAMLLFAGGTAFLWISRSSLAILGIEIRWAGLVLTLLMPFGLWGLIIHYRQALKQGSNVPLPQPQS
jgi:hypothetical protein